MVVGEKSICSFANSKGYQKGCLIAKRKASPLTLQAPHE